MVSHCFSPRLTVLVLAAGLSLASARKRSWLRSMKASCRCRLEPAWLSDTLTISTCMYTYTYTYYTCIDNSPFLFLSLCSVVLYACGFSCVIQNAQSNRRISCPLNVFGNIFDTYCMYSICAWKENTVESLYST